MFFAQFYKSYGSGSLLKCKGNGETAWTWDEEKGGMKEIPCPCEKLEKSECTEIGILQFLFPDVKGAGVWQITTGSKNSIIDLNSSISYIRSMCGRIRMIPLILKREQIETQRIEDGKPKRTKHYTLKIDLDNISLRQLQQAALVEPERVALPAPDESKDDLFYPKNGFAPKTETIAETEADEPDQPEVKPSIPNLQDELNSLMIRYGQTGGKVSPETMRKIYAFTKPEEFDKAIKFYKDKLEEKAKETTQGRLL